MTLFARFSRSMLVLTALLCLWVGACGGGGEEAVHSADPKPVTPAASPETAPLTPAPALGSSSVTGTIVFAGEAPNLRPISMSADPDCASKHQGPVASRALLLGDGQTLGNVFVQVKNAPAGTFPAPEESVIIDQKGCLYEPYVLGVMAGQNLQFRNSDGILHNVHGLPKENREFNIGMPATVTKSDTILKRPEPVFPVKCDVHPWMRAYVSVMAHPFFAVSDQSGSYRIEGLPAGTYELEAWHEKLGLGTASVTVGEGETGSADFTFKVPS